ncbi:CPBP family intramembrane glutamic endopeptidase [Streptomyces sp. NPDC094143]|uniref:CPBP family intramembrane glutamic endopeptidase n=1 Tax=Streptomyces sp. NPDC094143 TaxID=3155310 RepID=UPI003325D978
MARSGGHHRWWRPPLALLFLPVWWIVLYLAMDLVAYFTGVAVGVPEKTREELAWTPLQDTALVLLSLALAIPAVMLTVKWIECRPPGALSSVTGRLRWRWLALCAGVAVPITALPIGGAMFLPGSADPDDMWVGGEAWLRAAVVLVAIVPFQAAAEEYVCRGWLTQAVGAYVTRWWIAVVPQAVLFAAAHGWGTPSGFLSLTVFGLLTGYLTVRTGGLEAAIGMHAVSNTVIFLLGASVVGGLSSDETAADAPWSMALIDMTATVLYTVVVLWLHRRRGLRGQPVSPKAPAVTVHPEQALPAAGTAAPGPAVPGTTDDDATLQLVPAIDSGGAR